MMLNYIYAAKTLHQAVCILRIYKSFNNDLLSSVCLSHIYKIIMQIKLFMKFIC